MPHRSECSEPLLHVDTPRVNVAPARSRPDALLKAERRKLGENLGAIDYSA